VSKLVAVARSLPAEIIDAIGRAPKIGRPRWLALVEVLSDEEARERALRAMSQLGFRERETDERFIAILSAASKPEAAATAKTAARVVADGAGSVIGRIATTDKQWRLSIDRNQHDGFAEYLAAKLPALFDEYRSERKEH
jgi:ParB family transcriptional regulator, chromosome partitioning protein